MTDRIPLFEIAWDEQDVLNAVESIGRGGYWAKGPFVEEFETGLASYLGVDHALVVNSGTTALVCALKAIGVGPGDEVVVPSFSFIATSNVVRLVGAEPVFADIEWETYGLDPDAVEDAITEDTAAFVVNSPANPTGAVQSEADMREFARIADEHDVLCISDEVYEHIVFEGEHHSPLKFAETDNVVTISACSKTYSMTGWRLGWVVASNRRIERMLRVHQYGQACASAPAQYAAEAALTGPQEPVQEMVDTFEQRRDLVLDGLTDAGLEVPTPEGAFYAMPKVPEGWCDEVLDRGVVVVPGDAFGSNGAGYARLSYATGTEELKEALEIIDDATRAVR